MFKLTLRLLLGNRINLLNALICFVTLPFLLTLIEMARTGWRYHADQQAGFLPDQVIFLPEPAAPGILEALLEGTAAEVVTGGHLLLKDAVFKMDDGQSPPQTVCLMGRRFNAAPVLQLIQGRRLLEVTVTGYHGADYLEVTGHSSLEDGPCRLVTPNGELTLEAVDFGANLRLYLEDTEDKLASTHFNQTVTNIMSTFADPRRGGIGWDRFAVEDDAEELNFDVTLARFCTAYAGLAFPSPGEHTQVLASGQLHRIIGDGRSIQEMSLTHAGQNLNLRVLDSFSLAPEKNFPGNLVLFAYRDFDRLFQFGGKTSYAFL